MIRCARTCALALVMLACIGAAPPGHVVHYRVDTSSSDVNARVSFFGIAHKTAQFPDLSGGITLQPDMLEAIDLDVTIDARTLTAGDKLTLERLKGPNFFDVANFPTVRFKGKHMMLTGPRTARIDGMLTAHGVTQPQRLDVTFDRAPAAANDRDPIDFEAMTTIDRRDFGMTAYGLIVGKKVAITIHSRMVPVAS